MFEQDYYRQDALLHRRRTRRTYFLAAYNELLTRDSLTTPVMAEPRVAGDATLPKPFRHYWSAIPDDSIIELWKRLEVAVIEEAEAMRVKELSTSVPE